MYHKITIIGNLGRDPEMRYTQDGTPVTNFSVATDPRRNRPDGSQAEETIWFRVSAWQRLAETCNEYLQKGRQVFIEGRLKPDPATGAPRIWTGNDGVTRAQYEITAFTVRFLGRPGEAPPPEVPGAPEEPPVEEEGEIPF